MDTNDSLNELLGSFFEKREPTQEEIKDKVHQIIFEERKRLLSGERQDEIIAMAETPFEEFTLNLMFGENESIGTKREDLMIRNFDKIFGSKRNELSEYEKNVKKQLIKEYIKVAKKELS